MENKAIVKQVADAFLASDIEKALSYMTDDVEMGWPGFFDLKPGKDAVRDFFTSMPEILSGQIGEIIEEGNRIAATGRVTSREEDGSVKNSHFCDLYEFENDKVRRIKSYMVFEQQKQEA